MAQFMHERMPIRRSEGDRISVVRHTHRNGRLRHRAQVIARFSLESSDHQGLYQQVEGAPALRHDGIVHGDAELPDGEQRSHGRKKLAVRREVLGDVEDRRVRHHAPQHRNHRQIERRHREHVDAGTPLGGDALRYAEYGIQRSLRIDLDHHLQSGLDHPAGHFLVRRQVERTLVHGDRDLGGPGRDVYPMHFLAAVVESRANRRHRRAAGTRGGHEDPQKGGIVGDQRDGVCPRLDRLDEVRRRFRLSSLDAACQPALGAALQPGEERGVRRSAKIRATGQEHADRPKAPEGERDRAGESRIVVQDKPVEFLHLSQLSRERTGEAIRRQVQPGEGRERAQFLRDRPRQGVGSEKEVLQSGKVAQFPRDRPPQFVTPGPELSKVRE